MAKKTSSAAAGGGKAKSNIVSLGPNDKKVNAPTGYSTYTNMYKTHPIVRSVIDKIAKACSATGHQFVPRDPSQTIEDARTLQLNAIFDRSKSRFLLRQTYTDLLIYGDAYWWITNSRLGVPYSMRRVHPSQVSVIIDQITQEVTSYTVRDAQGIETQYGPDEIIHFLFFDPNNDVYGLSPLESLKSTVAQDLFAQTYNEAFFANSAQTGIVFNMQGASREEVERNREFLKKEYVSAQNAHKPLLLEGDVKVSRSVASPAEMQFIEGRQQLTSEILAVFDMPYSKLGGAKESANRSQASENDKSFREETVVPIQTVVEEAISEQFIYLVLGWDDILFQHREVDQRSEDDQMKTYSDALDNGIFDLNYIRKSKLGLPPVDGGDEPWIKTPLGVIPVSKIASIADAMIALKASVPQPGANAPAVGQPGPSQPARTNGGRPPKGSN